MNMILHGIEVANIGKINLLTEPDMADFIALATKQADGGDHGCSMRVCGVLTKTIGIWW